MADEQDDDDILFEQLAKRLEAVRRDVEMARSAVTDGTEGIRARLARIATDLHNLSSPLDTLNHRFKQQYAVNARLTKAAAKAETELKDLHQTIEALSQRIHEQAELLAKYRTGGFRRVEQPWLEFGKLRCIAFELGDQL